MHVKANNPAFRVVLLVPFDSKPLLIHRFMLYFSCVFVASRLSAWKMLRGCEAKPCIPARHKGCMNSGHRMVGGYIDKGVFSHSSLEILRK